jgi:1-deoxy-D-xylulose-5-phosphate synthase
MKPVVAIYSTFMQRAFDMLVQDIALQRIPVVFALDRAGLVGDDGPTHHGVFDLSYLRLIPGLVIMAPSSQAQLQHMVHTALRHDGPVALRYPRGLAAVFDEPKKLEVIALGTAEVLREGHEVALIGVGTGVGIALGAADLMAAAGVRATVVDARFVKPLDTALLDELAATHARIVTIEENVLSGGFGSAVAEHLADTDVRVRRFGLPDRFVAHGDRERLLTDLGLTPEAIAAAVLERQPGLAHIS